MPVITFAIPKGGAGKTTAAVLLAGELAEQGATVAIVDADPNRNVVDWARLAALPDNLTVIGDATEDTLIDIIDAASSRNQFVIVDLEGSANVSVSYAIASSDFVVIPVQASQLDAKQAARQIRLIRGQEKVTRRSIPFVVLLTRTNPAVIPRTLRHVEASFAEHGVPLLATRLTDREAFRAMFSFGGTLSSLRDKGVSNLDGARQNVRAYVREIIECLRDARGERSAADNREPA